MHLLHLEINRSSDLTTFINFWSKLYSYSNELVYKNAIPKNEFIITDIQALFEWKNGMNLSDLKQKSLNEKIVSKIAIINHLKSDSEVDLTFFKKGIY